MDKRMETVACWTCSGQGCDNCSYEGQYVIWIDEADYKLEQNQDVD